MKHLTFACGAIGGLLISLTAAAEDGSPRRPIDERFAQASNETPNFQRHIVPLLGRLGCNGRSCHGSFQGQGGFRLSMFGYDFQADHQALTGGEGPRVDLKSPAESLILLKPTSEDEHGGGKRYDVAGWQYRVLRRWIETGVPENSAAAGKLVRLEVTPAEIAFASQGQQTQLRAIAHWSDGTREDVTPLCRFSTNDDGVAQVSLNGLVTAAAAGATHIVTCYDIGVEATAVLQPVSSYVGNRFPPVPQPTKIDELAAAQWRKLGILPSPLCSDADFLRRASFDIIGTLPSEHEVRGFLADSNPDKRARKIDELLERPEYAVWWANRLNDLTGLNAPAQLGNTEFALLSGQQWQAWMERKVAENLPYDRLVAGLVLATSRKEGESYDDFALRMSSYTRKQQPADFAGQDQMHWYWFRGNLKLPQDKALNFAYAFLGVRLDCAQCHKHPFDIWTQRDFDQFTALFERVATGVAPDAQPAYDALKEKLGVAKMKNAAERRGTYRRLAEAGEPAPWYELFIAAPAKDNQGGRPLQLLGGREIDFSQTSDPRQPLMDWLRSPDNPYFARAFVNRVWAHYFGKGIVDPPDDLNLANPPSNKDLLTHLEQRFIASGFDMKHLHREIANSRTYQLSWEPNETNRRDERLFSHAAIRRLPAEVAVDALLLATAGDKLHEATIAKPAVRKIAAQPTADARRMEHSLAVFGKPLRATNCDCERASEPSLLQSIFVRNDADVLAMLDRPGSWLKTFDEAAEPDALLGSLYLRTLSREPTSAELEECRAYLAQAAQSGGSRRDALRDILWALLNTQEFITNH